MHVRKPHYPGHLAHIQLLLAQWSKAIIKTLSQKCSMLLAILAVSATVCVASARAETTAPQSLSSVQGLSKAQIGRLQTAGITSLARLAESKPQTLMQLLKVSEKHASSMIALAAQERIKLDRGYHEARNRFKLPPIKLPGSYASLITPTNECTLLVRKVCGLENQCSTSTGCEPSMTLLQRYNSAGTDLDRVHVAESCLMALQDQIIFSQCTP